MDDIDQLRAECDHFFAATRAAASEPFPPPVQLPPLALDPNMIAQIVAAVSAALLQPQSFALAAPTAPIVPLDSRPTCSKKLPDVSEYNGDMAKLDSWKQNLVQQMHVNYNRYSTDREKIAYAKSCLTIGKKAHNFMNWYRTESLCFLTSFAD